MLNSCCRLLQLACLERAALFAPVAMQAAHPRSACRTHLSACSSPHTTARTFTRVLLRQERSLATSRVASTMEASTSGVAAEVESLRAQIAHLEVGRACTGPIGERRGGLALPAIAAFQGRAEAAASAPQAASPNLSEDMSARGGQPAECSAAGAVPGICTSRGLLLPCRQAASPAHTAAPPRQRGGYACSGLSTHPETRQQASCKATASHGPASSAFAAAACARACPPHLRPYSGPGLEPHAL
jgi:hypothetical protein